MPDPDQPELIQRERYATASETIRGRLPQKDWVTVADVCAAADLGKETVYAWIDEGRFEAIDAGSGTDEKPYWKIHRLSFLRFIERRIVGGH